MHNLSAVWGPGEGGVVIFSVAQKKLVDFFYGKDYLNKFQSIIAASAVLLL